ncbi:MAG TPA: aspartyl protease family protein [Pyrinomonadaceae bacterium]|nr:aspartyl protease family protein [Pyrinomonadaceae bacterium]
MGTAHSFDHWRAGSTTDARAVNASTSKTSSSFAQNRHAASAPAQRRGDNEPIRLPAAARFREVEGRGLLVKVWINNSGPYSFAIDTGAGATIISKRVAAESRVALAGAHAVNLSGLSGVQGAEGREASLGALAIGARENSLPGRGLTIVTDALPPDLDGVLDPTESYWPLGYTIDLPNDTISAFDPRTNPLRGLAEPPGGAIVQWLFDGTSRRPFVALDTGRRALLDTGSGFGLALSEQAARSFGIASARGGRERAGVTDLGRGRVEARRVEPLTIQIGSLVLRRIPTDLLTGAANGAPVLLGRDALRPFEISFDPVSRLIRLRPGDASAQR